MLGDQAHNIGKHRITSVHVLHRTNTFYENLKQDVADHTLFAVENPPSASFSGRRSHGAAAHTYVIKWLFFNTRLRQRVKELLSSPCQMKLLQWLEKHKPASYPLLKRLHQTWKHRVTEDGFMPAMRGGMFILRVINKGVVWSLVEFSAATND